jgi:hypothetical protein
MDTARPELQHLPIADAKITVLARSAVLVRSNLELDPQ